MFSKIGVVRRLCGGGVRANGRDGNTLSEEPAIGENEHLLAFLYLAERWKPDGDLVALQSVKYRWGAKDAIDTHYGNVIDARDRECGGLFDLNGPEENKLRPRRKPLGPPAPSPRSWPAGMPPPPRSARFSVPT